MRSVNRCFMKRVEILSQSGESYSKMYRIPNVTCIELGEVQTFHRHEHGKNALRFVYQQKALAFTDSELELLNL